VSRVFHSSSSVIFGVQVQTDKTLRTYGYLYLKLIKTPFFLLSFMFFLVTGMFQWIFISGLVLGGVPEKLLWRIIAGQDKQVLVA
jgi:hypothetical protein